MKDKDYIFSPVINNTILHKFGNGDTIRKGEVYGEFKAISVSQQQTRGSLLRYIQLECVKCGYNKVIAPTLIHKLKCSKCKIKAKNVNNYNSDGRLILHTFIRIKGKKDILQGDIFNGFKALSASTVIKTRRISLQCLSCDTTITRQPCELDKMGRCNTCRSLENESLGVLKRIKSIEHGDICVKKDEIYNNLKVMGCSVHGKIILDCLNCSQPTHISATRIHEVYCNKCAIPLTKNK